MAGPSAVNIFGLQNGAISAKWKVLLQKVIVDQLAMFQDFEKDSDILWKFQNRQLLSSIHLLLEPFPLNLRRMLTSSA